MDRGTLCVAVLFAGVVGCGDHHADAPPDPGSVTFTYGESSDASGSETAAGVAAAVETARDLARGQLDAQSGARLLTTLVLLPQSLGGQVRDPSCAFDVTPGQWSWDCHDNWQESGGTFYETWGSGTLTYSESAISWEGTSQLASTAGMHLGGYSSKLRGKLTIEGSGIRGWLRHDVSEESSFSGEETGSHKYIRNLDLALTLDEASCPIAGTAELKELSSADQEGSLFRWAGCGAVTLATATR